MRVRLTQKLAECIDGVDLSGREVGDVFDAPATDGRLLIAENWAILERRSVDRGESARQFASITSHTMTRSATSPGGTARATSKPPTHAAADRKRHRRKR